MMPGNFREFYWFMVFTELSAAGICLLSVGSSFAFMLVMFFISFNFSPLRDLISLISN